MKTIKALCCATFALVSFGVFADAANVLISFSTPGPDTYADGKAVLDGERYALVWSADGNFDGIKTDCTPVDANDLVIYVAPLAKGGRCPYTVFQIDSQSLAAKRAGVYAVYLLDTRTVDKTAVVPSTKEGFPEVVNGAQATQDYAAAAAMASVEKKDSANKDWAESGLAVDVNAPDYKPLKISSFKVENAQVRISVEGMLPGVRYNVKMGGTPNKLESYALETPKTSVNGETEFVISAKDSQFFQVVREPLKK